MAAPLRVRYDGPYSMSLGDSFFPTLVKNMLYWEVPRQVVALLTRRALGKKAETSEEKEFVVGAPSYILSLAHAVLISGLGIKIAIGLWDAPVHDKFFVTQGMKHADLIDLIEWSNWIFFGYMADDLLNVLYYYPKLGKLDMVAHHAVFLACAILAGSSQSFLFPFSWLLAGELSTPLLTARWFVRTLAAMKSPLLITAARGIGFAVKTVEDANKKLEVTVAVAFMVAFFFVRVVVYGGGLSHTLFNVSEGVLDQIPFGVRTSILGILLAGAGLNAYWFHLMVSKAAKKFSGKKNSGDGGDSDKKKKEKKAK